MNSPKKTTTVILPAIVMEGRSPSLRGIDKSLSKRVSLFVLRASEDDLDDVVRPGEKPAPNPGKKPDPDIPREPVRKAVLQLRAGALARLQDAAGRASVDLSTAIRMTVIASLKDVEDS